jgi:hypothetical protein
MDERMLELRGDERTEQTVVLDRERSAPPIGMHVDHPTGRWARRRSSTTPCRGGSHSVTCTHPETHATRTVRVDVQAGQTTRTRITL